MDIIGIGYLGFETTKVEEWRAYGPQVMGFQIGQSPASDPDSLYFRTDDRRHRFAFHPGKVDRLAYIGWEAKGKIEFEAAITRFQEHGVEVTLGDAALCEQRGLGTQQQAVVLRANGRRHGVAELRLDLLDRIKRESIPKSLLFMPMAISFVGASVIWKFIYDYRGEGQTEVGALNAIVTSFGGTPQAWLTVEPTNSFLLMVVLIWIQTGFAMVILSAALRGIPEETIEAAVIDGANDFEIFFKIKIPQIMGTVVVVWTTITLVVLKVFDIVFAMTNGQWETQVLANYMFDKLFRANDWGVGSASAMVIMLLVLPILVWNVYNARKEMR